MNSGHLVKKGKLPEEPAGAPGSAAGMGTRRVISIRWATSGISAFLGASPAFGEAAAVHLCAGYAVTLTAHPREDMSIKWRLPTIRHEGVQPQAMKKDGVAKDGGWVWRCRRRLSLSSQPHSQPHVPASPQSPHSRPNDGTPPGGGELTKCGFYTLSQID